MSWTDKVLKRREIDKLIKQIESSPEWKKNREQELSDAVMTSFVNFTLIACDYLQLKCGYGEKRMRRWITFAIERMKYVQEDEGYFLLLNQTMKEEIGLDVMKLMGVEVEDET